MAVVGWCFHGPFVVLEELHEAEVEEEANAPTLSAEPLKFFLL